MDLFDDVKKFELQLTKEDAKKVAEAVNQHLQDPSTREKIRNEVKDLANTVVSIEEDFARIRGEVERIDDLKILRDKEDTVLTYAPGWKELHNDYTDLMALSQSTANKAYSEIDKLLHVIMPIASGNFDIKRKDKAIKAYIAKLEAFDVEAQEHAERFLRLQQRVEQFRVELKSTVEKQLDEVKERIEKIERDIKALQAELDKTSGFLAGAWEALKLAGPDIVKGAGKSTGIGASIGGVAATAGIAALAPTVGIGLLVAGFAAVGWTMFKGYQQREAQRKGAQLRIGSYAAYAHIPLRIETEETIRDLKQEKEALTLREEELKKALERLVDLDKTFDHLIDRLGAIHGVWRMLITDAQRLKKKLVDIDETDDDLITEMTAATVKATYEALMDAINTYAAATKRYNP
ncbi:hypothetical protein CVT24_005073 [Panaeolus cyanescens]|uniref:Uncharacterized protein n=1 Tax=Panaeolus cyanescens TaxID=181874 RepID=A0A409VPR0_9AGAR|nr:hypothetical protein CVT24_005073 [Panaeolus cyanescens]